MTPAAPGEGAPLTGNERGLTISALIVGGLVVLLTIPVIANVAYTLSTGRVFGGDLSKSLLRAAPGPKDRHVEDLVDQQLELQAQAQLKFAPYQLASEGVYLALWVGIGVFAISLLRGRGGRARLGQLALVAIVARLAVGAVTWALTTAVTRASTDSILSGMPKGGRGSMSAEDAERLNRGVQAAVTGLTALSAACITLIVCGYLAVLAYVFLRARPVAAPRV